MEIVVSNALGGGASVGGSGSGSTESGVTYVSAPAGRFPTGVLATIRNLRSGWSTTAAMIDGGLDPAEVAAQTGDEIEIEVKKAGEGSLQSLLSAVPAKRRPRVVRTVPTRKKTDVPLNARLTIVFSEPMDASTINSATVRVVAGASAVAGTVTPSDSTGLRFDFLPTSSFVANARHVIVLGSSIRDLDGDLIELGADGEMEFTTGAALAVASVVTEGAAMFTVPERGVRTFTMNAVRYSDGRVSGDWMIYYADLDSRRTGRISCFTIVGGNATWVAGVSEYIDGKPDASGQDWGWRAIGNQQTDQLSLAHRLDPGVLKSAQAFCADTPFIYPDGLGDIGVFNLESGDIVIDGATQPDPPPPPPPGMSQIAFSQWPNGIQLMRADGSGLRPLTSNQGDSDPAWSPDGQHVAFVRTNSLFTIDVDRTKEKRLTSVSYDRNPAWSPDGRRIAFARESKGIHVLNLQDGTITRISDGVVDSRPTWSPDGSRIAFSRYSDGPNRGIFVANLADGGLTRLTHDTLQALNPSWSPDGSRIAFQIDDCASGSCVPAIYIMNSDGTGLRRVTLGMRPVWSPDSKRLVIEDLGISLVSVDGSGRSRMSNGFAPAWSVGTMPPVPNASLTIELAGGDAQSDTVLSPLAEPLRVRVRNLDGSPVAGIPVEWVFGNTFGNSSPPTRASTTDADGIASTTLTRGSSAERTFVRAMILDGTAVSDGILFTIEVRPGNPVALQTWMRDTLLAVTDTTTDLAAFILDGHGNYVSGVPINWAVTSGVGSVAAIMDTTAFEPNSSAIASYVAWARASLAIGPDEGDRTVTISAPTLPGSPQRSVVARGVTKVVGVYWQGFDPPSVDVPAGRTVAWVFVGDGDGGIDNSHSVTFEDDPTEPVSSPLIYYGRHFRTFTGPPRTIRYRCTLHTTDFVTGDEIGVVIVK